MRDFNYTIESLLNIEKPEAMVLDYTKVKWLRSGGIEEKESTPNSLAWSYSKSIGDIVFVEDNANDNFRVMKFNKYGNITLNLEIPITFSAPTQWDVKKEGSIYKILAHDSTNIVCIEFDIADIAGTITETILVPSVTYYYISWGKTRDNIDCIYIATSSLVKAYTLSGALISSTNISSTRGIKYSDGYLMILADYYYKYEIPYLDPASGDFSEYDYNDYIEGDSPYHFGPNGILGSDGSDIRYANYPSLSGSDCTQVYDLTDVRTSLISGALMAGHDGDWSVIGQNNILVDDPPTHSYPLYFDMNDGLL